MPHRILIIDDSKAIQELVRAELAPEDLDVFAAFDGPSGIRMATELQPDVILLDLEMPGMNGHEVCELLGVQPATCNVPVMFLSATAEPADRVRGLNQGAMDYIAKPFSGDELRARIRVALRYKFLVELESSRAMRDGLTGLWNRRYFDSQLASATAAATRHGWRLSCVMADIDRFKSLNDAQGHPFGDQVLREVAQTLERPCRREDVICRYGGEEFVVLCPGIPAEGATTLAERLRRAVEDLVFDTGSGQVQVTCSLGISELSECGGEALVAAADKALYIAKREGRNRVRRASPLELPAPLRASA